MELKSKSKSPSFYETWQSYFKLVVRQDKEKNERGGSYHNKYQDFLWSKGNQNSVLLAEDRLADPVGTKTKPWKRSISIWDFDIWRSSGTDPGLVNKWAKWSSTGGKKEIESLPHTTHKNWLQMIEGLKCQKGNFKVLNRSISSWPWELEEGFLKQGTKNHKI